MKEFFSFLTDSLYYGFWTTTLLLLLFKKKKFLNFKTLVTSNNTLLLIWATTCYLKVCFYLIEGLMYYFDGSSYLQYSFSRSTNGYPLFVAFIHVTVPVLFVFKKMRASIRASYFVLGVWLAIMIYLLMGNNGHVYFDLSLFRLLFQLLLYLALLLLTYAAIQKRRKN